jgi:peptidylprolyl isomerase
MSDKEEKPPKEKKKRKTPAKPKEKPVEEKPERTEGVNAGDFILAELTGRSEETGDVFDTTSEETARQQGTYDEKRTYGPRLIVVGEGWVLKGLDERLKGLKVGEETKIEIPPAEAFGERDAENVQTIPFRILRSKGVNPTLGAELEIDGRTAVVRSIGAGRVQVDYNHPLAGRKIQYTVKVTELIADEKQKLKALIRRRFPGADADKFTLKKTKKTLQVGVPDELFFAENLQIAKRALANDVLRFFKELEEVEFAEAVKRT